MLVHRPRLKTQGAVVTAVAMLALGACTDPTARTDLRPEGPPDVLAVLVLNDALGGLVESATFCKLNDEKRPGLVGLPDFTTQQICPEDLGEQAKKIDNAAPQAWYIRVVFDELLDPNVEDLIPVLDENNQETGVFTGTISKTKPVTLQCQDFTGAMVNVEYDGYYSPSGNNVTWPLGPSLVVKPKEPTTISVNSDCQITLVKESIADKAGLRVLDDQLGPYPFKIAPIQAIATGPGDGETVDPEFGGVEIVFNTDLVPDSICNNGAFPFSPSFCVAADPTMTDSKATFTPLATNVGVQLVAGNDYFFFGDILDEKSYSFEIPTGTQLTDHCGKVTTMTAPSVKESSKVEFKTGKVELFTVAPFQGVSTPGGKIKLDFNQLMDPSSIDATEFTISPTPLNAAFRQNFNNDFSVVVLNGQYALDTEYTFTLNQGATVRDLYDTKDYVLPEAIVAKFRTAPAIALTASSPATNATVTKASATSLVSILLTFNQEMSPASFLAGTDYTLVDDATGQQIPTAVANNPSNPAQIRFRSTAPMPAVGSLAPGKYTFTFKAGAKVLDKVATPNEFTQSANRVIKFTVVDAAVPSLKCLGAP